MKRAPAIRIVLVTAPTLRVARQIAKGVLEARLAACANLVPCLESHYWWQGKIESSAEILIVFKTTRMRLPALEEFVLAKHPYDTPEFLVLPVAAGTERYLDWVIGSVRQ